MARSAEGWKLVPPRPPRTQYRVRFRWEGVRYVVGTGRSDPSEAATEAARIYAERVSGRVADLPVSGDLAKVSAEFLLAYGTQHAAGTTKTVEDYFRAHFLPHFRSLERFTRPTYGDYIAKRIQQATRSTLRKELSALRQFRDWLGVRGVTIDEVPKLPKHGHAGVRAKNARKAKAVIMRPAEVRKILAAMPERSRRTGCWVRPLFAVLWETGLRPITVLKLEAGKHYVKGSGKLFISRDIDKEGMEREVPITLAARKAFDRVWPKSGEGRLFDAEPESLRFSLKAALKAAGLEGRGIGVYDFKHSRITHDVNSGAPLAGVAHLVGHRHVSTTARYVTTGEQAARAVLRLRGRG
jgi:site-specific recombinase XerD